MVHSRLSSSARNVNASSNVCGSDFGGAYLFKTWKDEEKRKKSRRWISLILAKSLA